MKQIKTLSDIDQTIPEGRLLMMALAKISTSTETDKTPDQIIDQLNKTADEAYQNLGSFLS